MSWAKLDDKFFAHPKVIRTSFAARGLWVMALSWSSAMGTDGFIPLDCMRTFCGSLRARDRRRLGSELVAAGLWEGRPDGYEIHDFLDHNPSANQLKEKREQEAARLREYRQRTGVRTANRTRLPSRPDPSPSALASLERRRRSRTLPESETLTPERLRVAVECGLTEPEAHRQWQLFALHEFKDPHSDWNRAWKKWCLNAVEYRRNARPPETGGFQFRGPSVEATRKRLAEIGR